MRHLFFICLWLALGATFCQAQFVIDPATYTAEDCGYPALASSPDGTSMLAYVSAPNSSGVGMVSVQRMMTTRTDSYFPETPLPLQEGSKPVVCWSNTGFHMAFAAESVVYIYHSDTGGTWDTDNYTTLATTETVRSLEILAAGWESAAPLAYLAVHTTTPEYTNRVFLSSFDANGWNELAALDLEAQMTRPQMVFQENSGSPNLQLFYIGGDMMGGGNLKSATYEPQSGWGTPHLIMTNYGSPSPIQNEFDVAMLGDLHIVGLGLQPTCPCGTIYDHSYNSITQTWAVEELTAHYADMDWPHPPCVAIAEYSGHTHAFWFQISSGPDLTPWNKTLEYRTLDGNGWIDAGDFLDEEGSRGGPIGRRVALSVDPNDNPVLAWTRRDTIAGVPQPKRVWMARKACVVSVPDADVTRSPLALSAWPNPFNPRVKLALDLEFSGHVVLDIFDARGHLVTNLLQQVVGAGRSEFSWDGRDDSGRHVSSGVYFARVVSGANKSVLKLVLAE